MSKTKMGQSCLLYMSQMLDQPLQKGGAHALILANANAVTLFNSCVARL